MTNSLELLYIFNKKECRNPGLNRGPLDLQSNALPTELLRPLSILIFTLLKDPLYLLSSFNLLHLLIRISHNTCSSMVPSIQNEAYASLPSPAFLSSSFSFYLSLPYTLPFLLHLSLSHYVYSRTPISGSSRTASMLFSILCSMEPSSYLTCP